MWMIPTLSAAAAFAVEPVGRTALMYPGVAIPEDPTVEIAAGPCAAGGDIGGASGATLEANAGFADGHLAAGLRTFGLVDGPWAYGQVSFVAVPVITERVRFGAFGLGGVGYGAASRRYTWLGGGLGLDLAIGHDGVAVDMSLPVPMFIWSDFPGGEHNSGGDAWAVQAVTTEVGFRWQDDTDMIRLGLNAIGGAELRYRHDFGRTVFLDAAGGGMALGLTGAAGELLLGARL